MNLKRIDLLKTEMVHFKILCTEAQQKQYTQRRYLKMNWLQVCIYKCRMAWWIVGGEDTAHGAQPRFVSHEPTTN